MAIGLVFVLINFGAKMVNIAYSDCFANANSGPRQVLCFFSEYSGSYEEYQGECSLYQPLGGPQGAPKVPQGPYVEKCFLSKVGSKQLRML